METSFDMNQCKRGDKLISKHGEILEYIGRSGPTPYPHRVKYSNGSEGTRTNDGHVFARKRMEEDHDIVGFAPLTPQ